MGGLLRGVRQPRHLVKGAFALRYSSIATINLRETLEAISSLEFNREVVVVAAWFERNNIAARL